MREGPTHPPPTSITCADRLELIALAGIPVLKPGDDLPALLVDALRQNRLEPRAGDVLVVASKAVSRAEGRFVDVSGVTPGAQAETLARETEKDPRLVELILRESSAVSRAVRGALIVRHRLGHVSANAGIDASNARPPDAAEGSGPWVLLLPADPDASARALRDAIRSAFDVEVGVIVTDSLGRPFRLGTVGAALGVASLPVLWDQRGSHDLHGRELEVTVTALADQLAAAADLVAGQGAEGRAAVLVRGLSFTPADDGIGALLRPPDQDLYA